MEEGGERFEEENRKLRWIKAFNDRRMGLKGKEETENMRNEKEEMERVENTKGGAWKCGTPIYPREIFRTLQKLRQCSLLTDLILSVDSGLSFQAHFLVMAAVSSVLQQKLQERDMEKPKEMFLCLVPEVSGLGLSFTCTALQLQFQAALSLCLQFLEQQMDIHNCLDVVAFAEAYMIGDLLEKAEDFILIHFHEVAATQKFLDLSANKLMGLLHRDDLCTPSELAVFQAVVAWIEADPAARMPLACQLMAGVRFPLMTFREFCEVRAIDLHMECVVDDGAELYRSALREFGFGGAEGSEVQHRVRRPKDALVVVGGDQLNLDNGRRLPSRQLWFANSLRSGMGLVKEIEWRMLGEMPEHARFRHGVGVLDGKLYVAGGCHYYSKADTMKSHIVCVYNPFKNSWEKLPDMHEYRSNFMVVVRGDSLYAIGGDRNLNTNLDSVEKYSPDTNTWSFEHPLDQPLSGHAASIWRGEIFISGGFNCSYECLVSMLVYHPEQGTTYLADMTHDRAQHCMETLADRIWVAGGVCNLRKFYTDQLACESYDPIGDSWTAFSPLTLSHVGAASVVLEGKIYILGGYCQEDYSEARLVHRYDPGTQRWENMGKMAGPITDIRACLLHLPAELRQ
uniref:BACK domain-containing protein n=1 Tax=Electrophorus electricus TaxID=8005 RepID=A0AAY5F019_ELEEL